MLFSSTNVSFLAPSLEKDRIGSKISDALEIGPAINESSLGLCIYSFSIHFVKKEFHTFDSLNAFPSYFSTGIDVSILVGTAVICDACANLP